MSSSPVIMIIDDETKQLVAMLNALMKRFGNDYEIVSHLSAKDALEELRQLKENDEKVALIIADQWMPGMTGVELLKIAHTIHPNAQRALLVAWGDRNSSSTILKACAMGNIENYILKPWHPAEVHLYPIVGEFLSDWTRENVPNMEIVRVIGKDPSPRTFEIRMLLERNGIPYGFHSVDSEQGQDLLNQIGGETAELPVVILFDGDYLANPSKRRLSELLGATDFKERTCDLAIIGAGPAGLAAGVYAASEGLRTLIIERDIIGGQAGTSSLIRNYMGFPRGISGAELARRAYEQAWLFGAKYALARAATQISERGKDRVITLSDGTEISARAVLITTGADYRRLNIPNLERFSGAGLYYVTGNNTWLLRDKKVLVAGGGNSAGQAVIHLAKVAKQVTLLVRGESLEEGMSDYLIQEIRRLSNVTIRLHTKAIDGDGGYQLESVTVKDTFNGDTETLNTDLFFVMIGAVPHTKWLADSVSRDKSGFILTGRDLHKASTRRPMRFETSLPGVFAAGDVRHGSVKRVASAVGEGSVALQFIHDYLKAPVESQAQEAIYSS